LALYCQRASSLKLIPAALAGFFKMRRSVRLAKGRKKTDVSYQAHDGRRCLLLTAADISIARVAAAMFDEFVRATNGVVIWNRSRVNDGLNRVNAGIVDGLFVRR
jgi:hypothetical protein